MKKEYINQTTNNEATIFHTLVNDNLINGNLIHVSQLLKRAVKKAPNNDALFDKDQVFTYEQLYNDVCTLQADLETHAVQPGDRIVIHLENCAEFYIAYFAAWQIDAIVVPINTFLSDTEVAHIIADAQPTIIITDKTRAPFFKTIPQDYIRAIIEQDAIKTVTPPIADRSITISNKNNDSTVILLYTSGTTGTPKGVMLSSRNIMTNVIQSIARFGTTENERALCVLPLFHVFAQITCIWSSFFTLSSTIIVPKIDRRAILRGLAYKPTIFLGVPALYGLLCLMKNAPLSSVRYFISGGDALPDKIYTAFALIYRRKIANGYGLTEASPVVALDCSDTITRTNTVGRLLYNMQYNIRSEDGYVLPQGQIGQLWIRGDNIMLGYYNAPELTARVLQNGWLDTGDCGYIDTDNRLVITGRQKDLIINKGMNIYPQQIENIILSHPNVLRVGVIGKKDELEGEIPIAFVQIIKKEESIENTLKKLCRQELASYKVPRSFMCSTNELQTTATGKVDKKYLREIIQKI